MDEMEVNRGDEGKVKRGGEEGEVGEAGEAEVGALSTLAATLAGAEKLVPTRMANSSHAQDNESWLLRLRLILPPGMMTDRHPVTFT